MTTATSKKEIKLINKNEIDSPYFDEKIATGRAICRICGEKINKGENEIKFLHSFTDGSYNPWTSVECHTHEHCLD